MKKNPKFNDARGVGSTLQLKPPFVFKGVTLSMFPLRASLSRLQGFCEAYLNQSPSMQFHPFIPYVYLMLVDYGQMSSKAADMGWVSQREVAFAVPLRWLVKKRGVMRFHSWALHCPFIFVDNELSMTTGREVFGWPKVMARLNPSIDKWISDPHGTRGVFSVSAKLFEENYLGQEGQYLPFLEVHHSPVPSLLDIPPNLGELFTPLARLPNMVMNAAGLGADLIKTFGGVAIDSIKGSSGSESHRWFDPNAWVHGLRDLGGSLSPGNGISTINFKQFRDAADPWAACYQAITTADMGFETINRGGLLGPQNLMLGKPDGGYRIDIRRFESLPIVDALGLEIDQTRMDGVVPVASLRPEFPFWYDCDMTYGAGKVVTWRSRRGGWQVGDLKLETAEAADKPHDAKCSGCEEIESSLDSAPTYSTAKGPSSEAMSGPFSLPDTTVRVLPLLADEKTLTKFVGDYLNVEGKARFEAWGPHVYMIVYNYNRKSSDVNSLGVFSNREINFAVPVKWYDPNDTLLGVALVTPFAFVDDASVAITSSEVEGVPTLNTELASPPHRWMQTKGPAADRGDALLDTTAYVLPALGVGAGGSYRTFLQVSTDELLPSWDSQGWRHVTKTWGDLLRKDLARKYRERGQRNKSLKQEPDDSFRFVRAMALALLTGKATFDSVTLKQFRDAWHTDRACYQALVVGHKRINRLHELHELEDLVHVHIQRYPTQPISEILGLHPKFRYDGASGAVEVFEAIRPFWLRADLTQEASVSEYERVGTCEWMPVGKKPEQKNGELIREFMSGSGNLDQIDRNFVPDLGAFVDTKESRPVTAKDFSKYIDDVMPATVLDSILSRQWGRPEHTRKSENKADFCVRVDSLGPALASELFPPVQRQDNYWPQSRDARDAAEQQRRGLCWQLQADVRELINAPDSGYGSQDSAETEYRYLYPFANAEKVRHFLPKYLLDLNGQKAPGEWTRDEWRAVAEGLKQLIDASRNAGVDWHRTLRPLWDWAKTAREMEQRLLELEKNPDSYSDTDVVKKFRARLKASAAPRRGTP